MGHRRLLYLSMVAALLISSLGSTVTASAEAFASVALTSLDTAFTSARLSSGQASLSPTPTPAPLDSLTVHIAPGIDPLKYVPSNPFKVIFSEPMDPGSANPALLTYPYLPGSLAWSENNTALTFQPQGGFPTNRVTSIFLDRDLQSAAHKTFAEIQQWQINVLPGPRVTGHDPAGPDLADLRPAIKISFDREMDHSSVIAAIRTEPPVAFDAEWVGRSLILHPRRPLAFGQSYRFSIAKTAHDAQNIPLERDEAWQYWVPEPQVAVSQDGADRVYLKFNYDIIAQPGGPPFEIDPPVAGKWTWAGRMALFTADKPIPVAKEYSIRATAPLSTPAGDALSVPDVPFTPQPPIGRMFPNNAGFEEDFNIGIDFSVDMDHASTEAAFQVSPAVKAHFEWSSSLMSYRLDEPLQADTLYTMTLNPTARDAQNQPILLKPYTWTYKTSPWYNNSEIPSVYFGCEGANVQVVDANSPRSVQFYQKDTSVPATFSLYRLDLPKFTELYRTYYQYRGVYSIPNNKNRIPTDGLERAATWQVKSETSTQEMLLPSTLPTGLYILNASQKGQVLDQLFIALTTRTLVIKQTGSRLWVWASDINGKNAPDLEIRLYTKDGSLMREGKTSADGIYETTMPVDSPPMLVAGRGEGDDITIAGFDWDWRSSSNWWSDTAIASGIKGYLYTDRPIYRPGHTVNFKAILRVDDDARYTLPQNGMPVKVRVLDSRHNEVQAFDLAANEFGTVSGSFAIAEGAPLGDYSIEAKAGGSQSGTADSSAAAAFGSVTFKVEEYRKPDFQVQLSGEKDRYIAGEQITVDVATRYFFGEPLPNADLSIQTFQLQSWYWWGDVEDSPADTRYTWYPEGEAFSANADDKGHYQYTFSAATSSQAENYTGNCQPSWQSSLRRCTLGIEVTAKDSSGQEVSAVRIVTIYNASEKYTLDTGGWVRRPGEMLTVNARAVTLEGNRPVANRELLLEVMGWFWNGYNYDESLVRTYTLVTSASGQASQEIALEKSGSYSLRLSPADGDAAQVSTSDWIYVYNASDTWAADSWSNFNLTVEQTSYKPYQKARLAIQSDFSGPALLTFERGRVIHEQPVLLTAPLTMVETEIIPEYAPNVYVVVNAWKPQSTKPESTESAYAFTKANSRLLTGRVELQVAADQKALNITIAADKPNYAPRQEATFTIQVTGAQNQPVEAELSLALVDEAIYTLSGDLAGPVFQAFYGRRPHQVATLDSLSTGRALSMCGGYGGGGGGAGIANPRSDFPDTAAWYPALRTDANGKASLTLALPDSLTTWRVLVKAVSKQTQVGEGELKIVTKQEVIAQPVLPRVLTAGDQVELGALVHNYSGQAGEFAVALGGAGLEVQGASSQTVTLQKNEIRLVRWQVKAARAGKTNVDITVSPNDSQGVAGAMDAIRVPLEIRPRAMPEIDTQIGDFQNELTATLVAPETMLPLSTVEIKLSRSEAGSLLDGIDFLTGYPYGCVEQTMSRALPNAVVGRAFNRLGVANPLKDHLADLVNQGLQRLYGFQHYDGGWGWWTDDDSTDYQTAWVVFGLSITAEAGYPVDRQVIENGARYLKEHLSGVASEKGSDPRTQAYMLYSLAIAGQGDRERTLALSEKASGLDSFSQAALALALHRLKEDAAARAVLDGLVHSAARQAGMAYWESSQEDGEYYQKTMASSTRTTALALEAFVQIAPDNDLIPDIVRYLMSRRRADGWGTTNETAYTVLALTDHLQVLQNTGEAADYQITLNNRPLASGTLEWKAPLATVKITADQLEPGINLLKITQTGKDRLFYTINSRMVLDQPSVDAAGVVNVLREYLDPQTGKPVQNVQAGDLVRVRLTVNFPSAGGSYLIVEDSLPGGLEALNERLNTTPHYSDTYYDDSPSRWQEYGYNQKEIHGDRVSFFITQLSASIYMVDYLARANRPGTFIVPPAQVYAMYDDALWGRSASGQLTVGGE